MRRTDPRRRERDRCEGVIQGFQVILYKVDPRLCVFARNLLSKDCCRPALFNEVVESRPEVPLVIKPSSFACRAERLARTGTGPNRSIIWPAGAPKRIAPDANACEKVALRIGAQVVGVDILNAPCVYVAWRDVAGGDEIAQPLGGVGFYFVVVGGHCSHGPGKSRPGFWRLRFALRLMSAPGRGRRKVRQEGASSG